MIPHVVDYLRSGKTLEDLELEHKVVHRIQNGKVSLCYHQIDADKGDKLANQCRGLILREGTWDVVAYPFDRFFNWGEEHADQIDDLFGKDIVIQEKVDGTLLIVYHDLGEWHVATRKDPDAATVASSGKTYRDMAEEAAKAIGYQSFSDFADVHLVNKTCTHDLELTSPENQVVCQYEYARMWLLGIRYGIDRDFVEGRPSGRLCVDAHGRLGIAQTIAMVEERDPDHSEGVILVDYSDMSRVKRVKIKSKAYGEKHRQLSVDHTRSWQWRMHAPWTSLVEIVAKREEDQLISVCSDRVREQVLCVYVRMQRLFEETMVAYRILEPIDDMKMFAQCAKRHVWPDGLFALKRGKTKDLFELASNTKPKILVRLLRLEQDPCLGVAAHDERQIYAWRDSVD